MKEWLEVKIPPRMQSLETDQRGYPIPHIILRDNKGKPHFQINDTVRIHECIKKKCCAICGQDLNTDIWMIGGPLSAFHPQGAYLDSAVHWECGQYAMQVCPYIAAPSYSKRLDDKTLRKNDFSGISFLNPTVIPERPPFFVMAKTKGYTVKFPNPISWIIYPIRPFLEIEIWKNGKQISMEQAMDLLQKQQT